MPRDESSSRQMLQRFEPVFWECVVEGVRDYYREYQHVAHIHRICTQRDIIRDHVVARLRDALHDDPEVKFRDANQTTYIDFLNEFQCLAKKAGDDGKIEFARTQAAMDFQRHEAVPLFIEVPDVTNICLSYIPNKNDPMNPSVFVICPGELVHFWAYEIEPPAASIAIPEITPTAPVTDTSSETDLVRIPVEKKPESEDTD
jgi:hypothetical protein